MTSAVTAISAHRAVTSWDGGAKPPAILTDLYPALTQRGMSLVDVAWEQHRLHESRRWSVVEMLAEVDLDRLTQTDRTMVWNAGRAELTTKPGADRLERQANAESHLWREKNPTVAAVMEACGTWSRYWNEEEAHHETVFNRLAQICGMSRYRMKYSSSSARSFRTMTCFAP